MLDRTLSIIRARADELRARGFLHIAIFGSVARREDGPESDVDLVVEVGPDVDSMDALKVERLLQAEIGREVQIISRCGLGRVRHAEIFRDMIQAF
jgi:predicted nucleotidyltransferase